MEGSHHHCVNWKKITKLQALELLRGHLEDSWFPLSTKLLKTHHGTEHAMAFPCLMCCCFIHECHLHDADKPGFPTLKKLGKLVKSPRQDPSGNKVQHWSMMFGTNVIEIQGADRNRYDPAVWVPPATSGKVQLAQQFKCAKFISDTFYKTSTYL